MDTSLKAPHSRESTWLNLVPAWHALLSVASVIGIGYIWLAANEMADWVRIVATIVLTLTLLLSATAVPWLIQRDHRGRVLSLIVNYLGFLVCFLGSLHLLGVFVGIDTLANNFGRGIPYLALAFIGYLITTLSDRYESSPVLQRSFERAGKIVAILFSLLFLLAAGLLPGLVTLFSNFNHPLTYALTVAAILFGLMGWLMWRRTAAEAFQATNSQAESLSGYLFLSPNLLGFLFFFAGPLLLSLYVSFTDWDAFGTRNWVGLDNYRRIVSLDVVPLETATQRAAEVLDIQRYSELTRLNLFGRHYVIGAEDSLFWIALRNTLAFCLMAVPMSVVPALFLANLLNSKVPGMKFFRAIYFLPSIAAVVGVALIWQWLYNATVGYINYAISSAIHLFNQFPGVTLIDPQVRWLSDSRTALLAIVIMSAWQTMGFNTVLFLAGLQNIPKVLYEAATVDGAGRWRQFWNITLPMLAPTTFFVVTTTTIQAMQVFEQVFILVNPPQGPNNATLTMVLYLYQNGFQRFRQGYASAIAWVLFMVIFMITLIQFQRQRRGSDAYEG